MDSKTLEQTRKLGSLEAGTSQGARKDIYHRENKSEERKEPEKADLGTGREKGVRGITSPEKKSVEKEDLENGNGERSDEERGKSDEDGDNTSKKVFSHFVLYLFSLVPMMSSPCAVSENLSCYLLLNPTY